MLVKKKDNFNEWYNEIIKFSNLSDKRYPIKGVNVWTIYGWKIMKLIDKLFVKELRITGHEEVNFPLLIPLNEFNKEKKHIKGFDSEVFWVNNAGNNKLDYPLIIRPTSETAMYPMFSMWVRSYKDLPLKTYQIGSVFRYETKQTKSFLRVREIHFIESHTCHCYEYEAEEQIKEYRLIFKSILKKLGIPFIFTERPSWDKFPGAEYSIGVDTFLPNFKILQIGSIHNYKNNFSSVFDIFYENEKGEKKLVYQTTMGSSERILGAIIALHGDDKGVVLPPVIAPIQIIIIPIFNKDNGGKIFEFSKKIEKILVEKDFRVMLDSSDESPGFKYNESERKGIPVRIEVGEKELESNSITYVLRFNGEKKNISLENLNDEIYKIFEGIEEGMNKKYVCLFENSLKNVEKEEDFECFKNSVYKFNCCDNSECYEKVEKKYEVSVFGICYDDKMMGEKCLLCDSISNKTVLAAKKI